jgi:hypothetical protein
MSPKKREEIEVLARDSHQKHKRLIRMQRAAAPGDDKPQDQENGAVEMAIAQAEYAEAKDKLKMAIRNAAYEET